MPLSPSDAAFLQRFLDGVEWRFAKTYVASYPHEYTVKRLCPPEEHARVIALIEEHGVVEPFYAARRKLDVVKVDIDQLRRELADG